MTVHVGHASEETVHLKTFHDQSEQKTSITQVVIDARVPVCRAGMVCRVCLAACLSACHSLIHSST